MANPNIVNVANIFGKTVVQSLTGSYASVLANVASSGKVLKVNTIIASNLKAISICSKPAFGVLGNKFVITSSPVNAANVAAPINFSAEDDIMT